MDRTVYSVDSETGEWRTVKGFGKKRSWPNPGIQLE
jgi:hypothetical protein